VKCLLFTSIFFTSSLTNPIFATSHRQTNYLFVYQKTQIMRKLQNKAMILFAVALLALPVSSFAWGTPPPEDCNDVPLDGGLSLLAVAGVGYGAKKIAEKRKKNLENKGK
jgi:hypothetical protein